MIAATVTNTAVHTACVETEFKPIDKLSMVEPPAKTQTGYSVSYTYNALIEHLRRQNAAPKSLPQRPKQLVSNVMNHFHLELTQLEDTNHVI